MIIQNTLDYIEKHLTDDLDTDSLAERVYLSPYYLQRVFSIISGFTLGEYIRNRRLSEAGKEILLNNSKIIDLALKYGYDTPESFTRAFTRFHGVTPSQARATKKLKSFSELHLRLIIEGGKVMEYRIEEKAAFKIIMRDKAFDSETARQDIPLFWDDVKSDGTMGKLCGYMNYTGDFSGSIIGVCFDDESLRAGCFRYGIGVEYCKDEKTDLTILDVSAHTWVIFKCLGPLPEAIQKTWDRIYREFFPTTEYEAIPGIDMEVYPDGDNTSENYWSEIWIPIRLKH
ncbi:MAG: AraC family transcriptional regulator, partial [Acholeplasmataceae bacterium]|nr:AraC family transcriptional regulator [Acholeplasmataceae bacterium]